MFINLSFNTTFPNSLTFFFLFLSPSIRAFGRGNRPITFFYYGWSGMYIHSTWVNHMLFVSINLRCGAGPNLIPQMCQTLFGSLHSGGGSGGGSGSGSGCGSDKENSWLSCREIEFDWNLLAFEQKLPGVGECRKII